MFDSKAYAAKWRAENKEKISAYAKQYRADNKEKLKAKWKAGAERTSTARALKRQEEKEKYRLRDREHYVKNRDAILERQRKYRQEHPDKALAQVHSRRARKQKAHASWDEDLTKFVVTEAADLARRREKCFGFKWHIDHIVPLRGREICGLHVWNNIAVIPAEENLRKNNKLLSNTMLPQQ